MKIEWTDAAVERAMHAYDNTLGRMTSEWADRMRAALYAATAEQFKPETDAEKVKRLEAVLLSLQPQVLHGSQAYNEICQALAGPNSKET